MAYLTRNSAQQHRTNQSSTNQPSTKQPAANATARFADNRATTAAQLKQQSLMATSPAVTVQLKLMGQMVGTTVQRAGAEEEMLQGKFTTAQLAEDEELLQGKFETAQRVEDEELLQGKFKHAQLAEKPNKTGLPDNLKSGIESLSGMSMDNVKVHYNSDKPAQLNAHAYAQGSDIHVAPGQEQHLPHEAWHVVQQAQGRVKPTRQMKVASSNDNVISSDRPVVQRYYDRGVYRYSDDHNYAIIPSNPQSLFVKDGANLPHPISFFNQAAANPGWTAYLPKAALYNAPIYPDYHGPNDCGMYATALAKNNPSWGRIQQTYLSLIGKESGRYPKQDSKSVHENLEGGKTDREIDPQIGEALLIHPPEGSTSGSGGSSFFSYRCNFHAAPIVAKASVGGDYITSEADAGDRGRSFPHWEMYGTKKEQTFHYKNAIKYKDRLNSNPNGKEWPKTYALKTPARYQLRNKVFTRHNGIEIYWAYDTTYNCDTYLACLNNQVLNNLGSVMPDRYELLGIEVIYRNGSKVKCFHDGVNNVKSYRCFDLHNICIADYGSAWVKPMQYEAIRTKWNFLNGTKVLECHDCYNNQITHILVDSTNNSILSLIGPIWVEPSVKFEYISKQITYFGGDQVYYAYDGMQGRKTYIKVSATNQLIEDYGPFWSKPNQYELLEKELSYLDGTEVHYAHNRYTNDQSYILINPSAKLVVRDLGKNWKKINLLHF